MAFIKKITVLESELKWRKTEILMLNKQLEDKERIIEGLQKQINACAVMMDITAKQLEKLK